MNRSGGCGRRGGRATLRGLDHEIDGGFHVIIRQVGRAAFGRHHASLALITFDSVLVQGIDTLRNARRPDLGIALLGRARDPLRMAGEADLIVRRFAGIRGNRCSAGSSGSRGGGRAGDGKRGTGVIEFPSWGDSCANGIRRFQRGAITLVDVIGEHVNPNPDDGQDGEHNGRIADEYGVLFGVALVIVHR